MHSLELEISKLIKESSIKRLRSDLLTSTAMMTKSKTYRAFRYKRVNVLRCCNKFQTYVHSNEVGFILKVDMSPETSCEHFRGLFQEKGLQGMSEAVDMRLIDHISPFMRAIIDRSCDEVSDAPINLVFSQYVEIIRYIRYAPEVGWSQERLKKLS